jgi:TonB family protein
MTTAAFQSEEFPLKKFLVWSLSWHAAIAIVLLISSFVHFSGDQWSGTGSLGNETKVNLVNSAGIPMPQPTTPTESKTVDPTMSVNKEELVKPPEPKTDATPIQKFEKEKRLPPSKKSKVFEDKRPPPLNAVPGAGGSPKIPSGLGDVAGSSSPGVAMSGQAGGDFATRYAWYIAAAKRRVEPNWDRLSIDATVRTSNTLHCVIAFKIMRDGSTKDVRVSQSSGNLSWDNSGVRAILTSSPFAPLPSDWSGSEVSVLWDFPDSTRH